MKNESFLTIHVHDVDDMSPEFTNDTYYLEVIGEKPLDVSSPFVYFLPITANQLRLIFVESVRL